MNKPAQIILKEDRHNKLSVAFSIHAARIHDSYLGIYRAKVVYTNCFIGWNDYADTK